MAQSTKQVQIRRYLWRVAEVAALLLLLAVLFALLAFSLKYILPFVLGLVFAVLLLPIVKMLERRGVRRRLAVIIVMTSAGVLVLLLSVYAIVSVVREATLLSLNATEYFTVIDNWVRDQLALGQQFFGDLPHNVVSTIDRTALGTLDTAQSMFRGLVRGLLKSVSHLPETLFVVIIALIATFFMLSERDKMYQGFLRSLPPGWSGKMQVVMQDVMRALLGTIRVQVLLMLLSASLGVAGMWVMGIQYAVILGILFGLSGMIPMFGSAIVTVPWAVGALLLGDVALALKVLLLQAVISTIRHLVEPKILADNVGLDMLSTLFGLYVGLQVMGVIGLFLGPIVLIAVRSLFRMRMFVDLLPIDDDLEDGSVEQEGGAGVAAKGPTQGES